MIPAAPSAVPDIAPTAMPGQALTSRILMCIIHVISYSNISCYILQHIFQKYSSVLYTLYDMISGSGALFGFRIHRGLLKV